MEFPSQSTSNIAIDFVLVLDSRPDTNRNIPLFFGLYRDPGGSGQTNSHAVNDDVKRILEGYMVQLPEQVQQSGLFCSVLVEPYVHIYCLEHTKTDIKLHHVDAIAIHPTYHTDVELVERIRLVMAFFTIKRHTFRLAIQLGGYVEGDAPEERPRDGRPSFLERLVNNTQG